MEQAIRVGITSTLRQVYFRAGLAIDPGKSEMAVSPLQCETLEADPRLVVVRLAEDAEPSPADPPQTGGVLDAAMGGLSTEPQSKVPAAKPASGKGKGK
ncbi:MAG: hypothetical protein RIQ83_589 [Pseudomonadota bacterium]|jgi:hypothetical protein